MYKKTEESERKNKLERVNLNLKYGSYFYISYNTNQGFALYH